MRISAACRHQDHVPPSDIRGFDVGTFSAGEGLSLAQSLAWTQVEIGPDEYRALSAPFRIPGNSMDIMAAATAEAGRACQLQKRQCRAPSGLLTHTGKLNVQVLHAGTAHAMIVWPVDGASLCFFRCLWRPRDEYGRLNPRCCLPRPRLHLSSGIQMEVAPQLESDSRTHHSRSVKACIFPDPVKVGAGTTDRLVSTLRKWCGQPVPDR